MYDDAYDAYVEAVCEYEVPMSRREFERRYTEWCERSDRVSPELRKGLDNES
jgi:hypothetical protein|nr:MAG TPA: Selenoprotein, putative [Caudoviricetes sp.]